MTPRRKWSAGPQRTLVAAYFGLLTVIVFATQFAGTGLATGFITAG